MFQLSGETSEVVDCGNASSAGLPVNIMCNVPVSPPPCYKTVLAKAKNDETL
jgi:hypothetical protein